MQRRPGELRLDGLAHRVDPGGIVRLEEAGLRLNISVMYPVQPGRPFRRVDGRLERAHVGGGGVRLHIGTGERVRVPGAVDGGDVHALRLERLGHAGRAGEEIEGGAGAGGPADPAQDGDEPALRAEVLDHGTVAAQGPSRAPTLRWGVMAPGDHGGSDAPRADESDEPSHWEKWHAPYEDPASNLSLRLRTVQGKVRQGLDAVPSPATPARSASSACAPARVVT